MGCHFEKQSTVYLKTNFRLSINAIGDDTHYVYPYKGHYTDPDHMQVIPCQIEMTQERCSIISKKLHEHVRYERHNKIIVGAENIRSLSKKDVMGELFANEYKREQFTQTDEDAIWGVGHGEFCLVETPSGNIAIPCPFETLTEAFMAAKTNGGYVNARINTQDMTADVNYEPPIRFKAKKCTQILG